MLRTIVGGDFGLNVDRVYRTIKPRLHHTLPAAAALNISL